MTELFLKHVQKNGNAKGFIVDGYPRDRGQAEDFQKHVRINVGIGSSLTCTLHS